jgi:hypothetical protein
MDLISKVLSPINVWLDGKKSAIGGIGTILAALSHLALNLQDGLQPQDIILFVQEVSAGFAILGIAHKIQKIGD